MAKELMRYQIEDGIDDLEKLLYRYCENQDEQLVVAGMRAKKATILDYILALSDGLKYGNWPWSNVNKRENEFCGICKIGPCQCEGNK